MGSGTIVRTNIIERVTKPSLKNLETRTEEKRTRRTTQRIHSGMAKTKSQGGGGAEEIEGTTSAYSRYFTLFICRYFIRMCYFFQEKQAKRKVTRAEEEKRLAQKKKEEEERRQREIGKCVYSIFFLS